MYKKAIVLYNDYLFTVSFVALLKESKLFTAVKECRRIEDLKSLIENESINHLFIDFNMRRNDIISIIKNLSSTHKNLYIIVIAPADAEGLVYKLKQEGAHAFISKNSGSNEIINCIPAIHAGNYYVSDDVFHNTLKIKLETKKGLFTQREKEFLHYIASGKTIAEIAALLGLSPHTVVAHRRNMLKKSGVNNMPALIKKAMDMGLV